MSIIEVSHLRKEYPNATPLKDVNAKVERGEVISIIGPSGTGKSTFLHCVNRLETPTSGQILVDGCDMCAPDTDLDAMRRKMGMVFQSFNLFEHLLVTEKIMLGPVKLLGMSKQEAYERSLELLEQVGLKDKALNYPKELSGGQKQRVAICPWTSHESGHPALRRTHERPRSHHGLGSALRYEELGFTGLDNAGGYTRDAFRARRE